MNRAADTGTADFKTLQRLFLYLGGIAVVGQMFFLQEYTWDVILHRSIAYIAMGIALPVLFATISQASRFRWAATTAAGIYMVFVIAEILILPLFPAQPKLGPVFYPVTHLVPAKFPVLLIVPALALDLFWQRARSWKPWQIAIVSGILFVGDPLRGRVALRQLPRSPKPARTASSAPSTSITTPQATGFDRMRRFFHPDYGAVLLKGLTTATLCAIASTWVGLRFGHWMRGVQR